MRLLGLTCLAALVIAGCGGGDDSDTTAARPVAKPGPAISTVIETARKNAGFAGCKEVAEGAPIATPAATDPQSIHPLLCDNQQVGDYWVWKSNAEATAKTQREDRPSFVNGRIVVTTGNALLAKQFDADKAKTLPEEIKSACGCGSVVSP